MLSLWKKIEYWDQTVALFINRDGSNRFFDVLFSWIRESNMWAPLYLFIIVFVLYNFRWKGLAWILAILCSAALTDLVSSQFLKPYVGRLRPCNDPFMQQYIRFIVHYCPTSFSFTSSHAANHFGVAMFIWTTGKKIFGKWLRLFFVWAGLISYAQIYVAVHYPLDVICGTIVGLTIAYSIAKIYNKQFGLEEQGVIRRNELKI